MALVDDIREKLTELQYLFDKHGSPIVIESDCGYDEEKQGHYYTISFNHGSIFHLGQLIVKL